jgi:hypothetical protein
MAFFLAVPIAGPALLFTFAATCGTPDLEVAAAGTALAMALSFALAATRAARGAARCTVGHEVGRDSFLCDCRRQLTRAQVADAFADHITPDEKTVVLESPLLVSRTSPEDFRLAGYATGFDPGPQLHFCEGNQRGPRQRHATKQAGKLRDAIRVEPCFQAGANHVELAGVEDTHAERSLDAVSGRCRVDQGFHAISWDNNLDISFWQFYYILIAALFSD